MIHKQHFVRFRPPASRILFVYIYRKITSATTLFQLENKQTIKQIVFNHTHTQFKKCNWWYEYLLVNKAETNVWEPLFLLWNGNGHAYITAKKKKKELHHISTEQQELHIPSKIWGLGGDYRINTIIYIFRHYSDSFLFVLFCVYCTPFPFYNACDLTPPPPFPNPFAT